MWAHVWSGVTLPVSILALSSHASFHIKPARHFASGRMGISEQPVTKDVGLQDGQTCNYPDAIHRRAGNEE